MNNSFLYDGNDDDEDGSKEAVRPGDLDPDLELETIGEGEGTKPFEEE